MNNKQKILNKIIIGDGSVIDFKNGITVSPKVNSKGEMQVDDDKQQIYILPSGKEVTNLLTLKNAKGYDKPELTYIAVTLRKDVRDGKPVKVERSIGRFNNLRDAVNKRNRDEQKNTKVFNSFKQSLECKTCKAELTLSGKNYNCFNGHTITVNKFYNG